MLVWNNSKVFKPPVGDHGLNTIFV